MKEITTLVLDYDGVVKFNKSEYTDVIVESILKFLNSRGPQATIHIDSLRGISLFHQKAVLEILECAIKNKSSLIFSGCHGGFTYDLISKRLIDRTKGLNKSNIELICGSGEISNVLNESGQNDQDSWTKYSEVRFELTKYITEPRLYWDIGYPLSQSIFKCALDLPKGTMSLIEHDLIPFFDDLEGVKYSLTGNILELTSEGVDKFTGIITALSANYYSPGGILAIGDNPEGSDKELINAFPEGSYKGEYNYFGYSNSGDDENMEEGEKFRKALELIEATVQP